MVLMPTDVRDAYGRPLANTRRFPLAIAIDAVPPLVKFAAPFGILEAREGGVLPLTVRAVEPRLQEYTKHWQLGPVTTVDGIDVAEYQVQLKRKTLPDELLALVRAAGSGHLVNVELC